MGRERSAGSGGEVHRHDRLFGIGCTSTGQLCDPPELLVGGDPATALKVKKFVYVGCNVGAVSGWGGQVTVFGRR